MNLLKLLVRYVHILVRIFLVATPFFGNAYFLTLHLLIVPFIMLHWFTNQTVCVLTELERIVSRKPVDETFFGQVFTPIYKNESFVGNILKPFYTVQNKDEEKTFVWFGMILLFFITFTRLVHTDFAYLKATLRRIPLLPHT